MRLGSWTSAKNRGGRGTGIHNLCSVIHPFLSMEEALLLLSLVLETKETLKNSYGNVSNVMASGEMNQHVSCLMI